jgi:hypothetical protein
MAKYPILSPMRIKLNDANTFGAGKTSKFIVPAGYGILAIGLEYSDSGTTQTAIDVAITDIRLMANLKAIRTHNGGELDLMVNKVNGSQYAKSGTTASGIKQYQFLNFAEPWRKDKDDQSRLVFNNDISYGVKSCVLEVDLNATLAGTPTLVAFAIVRPLLAAPTDGAPLFSKIYRSGIATGQASQAISKVTIKRNGLTVFEFTKTQIIADLTRLDMSPNTSATAGAPGFDAILDAEDPVAGGLVTFDDDNIYCKVEFANGSAIEVPLDKGEIIQWLSFKNTDASGYLTYLVGRLGELD